jgi:hypothetical protein
VVDLLGSPSTKLSVRTTNIDARIQAHDGGWWGSQPGMVIGTRTAHALSFATSGSTRMALSAAGLLGIGTTVPGANLHLSVPAQSTYIHGLQIDVGSFKDPGNAARSYFLAALDLGTAPKYSFIVRGNSTVGIGGTNDNDPSAKYQLYVGGNTFIRGNLYLTGTVFQNQKPPAADE